jgi:hypothetical protein
MKNFKHIIASTSLILALTAGSAQAGCMIATGLPGVGLTCTPGGFTCTISNKICGRPVGGSFFIPADLTGDIQIDYQLMEAARAYCTELALSLRHAAAKHCGSADSEPPATPEFPEILKDSSSLEVIPPDSGY